MTQIPSSFPRNRLPGLEKVVLSSVVNGCPGCPGCTGFPLSTSDHIIARAFYPSVNATGNSKSSSFPQAKPGTGGAEENPCHGLHVLQPLPGSLIRVSTTPPLPERDDSSVDAGPVSGYAGKLSLSDGTPRILVLSGPTRGAGGFVSISTNYLRKQHLRHNIHNAMTDKTA